MTEQQTTTHVVLTVDNNRGYAADQAANGMTLSDLRELVDNAVAEYGEDALVVTKDTGNRLGARWGAVSRYEEIIASDEDEEES